MDQEQTPFLITPDALQQLNTAITGEATLRDALQPARSLRDDLNKYDDYLRRVDQEIAPNLRQGLREAASWAIRHASCISYLSGQLPPELQPLLQNMTGIKALNTTSLNRISSLFGTDYFDRLTQIPGLTQFVSVDLIDKLAAKLDRIRRTNLLGMVSSVTLRDEDKAKREELLRELGFIKTLPANNDAIKSQEIKSVLLLPILQAAIAFQTLNILAVRGLFSRTEIANYKADIVSILNIQLAARIVSAVPWQTLSQVLPREEIAKQFSLISLTKVGVTWFNDEQRQSSESMTQVIKANIECLTSW